ncbi:hypothetical protein E4P41_09910 [Geodermatophilus sp. DF01-2]|nr:hypothetical protein E4P41_09910 [Geodermatophilus sp. DF01_2]
MAPPADPAGRRPPQPPAEEAVRAELATDDEVVRGEPGPPPEPARATAAGTPPEPFAEPSAEVPAEPAAPMSPAADGAAPERTSRRAAHEVRETPASAMPAGEPAEEDVEVTDLLLVVDLHDEVVVVDEHPRYHLDGCPYLAGRTAVPLPMSEARIDGFTPCATCRPVRHLAEVERSRRRSARGN